MNAGAAVKRPREDAQLAASAGAKRRRRNPQLIGKLVAHPAFLHAFQSAVKQLQAIFPIRYSRNRSFYCHIFAISVQCLQFCAVCCLKACGSSSRITSNQNQWAQLI
jgi:hypothetical protein